MKQIYLMLIVLVTTVLPGFAEGSSNGTSIPIIMEKHPKDHLSGPPVHRLPDNLEVTAFYDPGTGCINIETNSESEGVVYLHRNNVVIGYSHEINTSFPVSASGLYKIEIVTEGWLAVGYLQL